MSDAHAPLRANTGRLHLVPLTQRAAPSSADLPRAQLGCRVDLSSRSTTDAIDRLIARITSGTATPEDVADLPDDVVGYLDAVLTLQDEGILGQDWDPRAVGDVLVFQVGH